MADTMKRILGIDVGATKIAWIFVDENNHIDSGRISTPDRLDGDGLVEMVIKLARAKDAHSIGIGLPGFVKEGVVYKLPNIRNFACPYQLEQRLAQKLDAKIYIENDVKCASLAHFWHVKEKVGSFVFIMPGTGLGGALVFDGRLIRGGDNTAGEFGHLKLFANPGIESQKIEFEDLCSGRGIMQTLDRIIKGRGLSRRDYAYREAKEVLESENLLARRVSLQAAYYFGMLLSNIATSFNPEQIVVSGSLSKAYMGRLRPKMLESFYSNCIEPARDTQIIMSPIENPALAGTVLLAKQGQIQEIRSFLH